MTVDHERLRHDLATKSFEAPKLSFAFYGRVSTEDNQDPESSRHWQLSLARTLITPRGGVIVEEFFDVGHSRSLPWQRRPEASGLLAASRLQRSRHRRAASRLLRKPVRSDHAAVHALRRPVVGAGGRRCDRSRQRGARPRHVCLRGHEQGRAEPGQGAGPHGYGFPDATGGPLPGRAPTVRLHAQGPWASPEPGEGRPTANAYAG